MNPSDSAAKPLALPSAPLAAIGDSTGARSGLLAPGIIPPVDGRAYLPPALADAPTWAGLLQALRRRWLLAPALAIVAATVAVGGVMTLMPAKYPAQVRLHIASRGDIRVFGEGAEDPDFLLYKKNMEAMLRSQAVLQAALNQKTSTGKDIKDLTLVRENGIDWLEFALKTDFLLGPEILKVVLSTDRPDESSELVNAVARTFVEENIRRDSERRDKRVKDYQENLRKLENELNDLRLRLRAREKSLKLPDESVRMAQFQTALQQQGKAAEAVTVNRTEQIKVGEELAAVADRLKNLDRMVITPEKLDEAFRKDFRTQAFLIELEKIEKEILESKANGRPDFIDGSLKNLERKKQDIAARISETKEQLRPEFEKSSRNKYGEELQSRLVQLQDQMGALQKQEPFLKTEVKKAEEHAKSLAPNNQVPLDVVNLQSKINHLESSVGDVSKTIQRMMAEVANPRVSIQSPASEPKQKDYSRQAKLAFAGGLGMFLMALFGVAFLEFRAGKINGADDLSYGLGLSIVGSLPAVRGRPRAARPEGAASALAVAAAPFQQDQLSEAIDSIRTLLLHASRSEPLRVIMVTSAQGGEGKTSLASQLAASLARAWRKTLLIDGDLRKPSAHKVFDVAQEPGFSELLRNEIAAPEAIKPTSVGRLWLMPAGHCDSHALQALAQDGISSLFANLKEEYDFIVIDSAPVLPVADALLLGQHADGVIFSVLRDVSRAPAVYAAQKRINQLAIRILGAVMIGVQGERGAEAYASTESRA